ncbi:hypothetical protein XELAEV_18033944mg [Xenopus laevis]|uniref:Uncharacterized protein n=1 Tax=Xenopus laevis TaxID=8355 RepID=A0A974HEV5_XENLA|nr:hypothetical protein XELAEV_18033944mg [Xenopus laevis]
MKIFIVIKKNKKLFPMRLFLRRWTPGNSLSSGHFWQMYGLSVQKKRVYVNAFYTYCHGTIYINQRTLLKQLTHKLEETLHQYIKKKMSFLSS